MSSTPRGLCQTITELAGETEAPITTGEFQTLDLSPDNAIAAVIQPELDRDQRSIAGNVVRALGATETNKCP